VHLPGNNSLESRVDDAKHNPASSPHFILVSKDIKIDIVEGVNSIGPISRDLVTQPEGGVVRHESLTREKGKGKKSPSRET